MNKKNPFSHITQRPDGTWQAKKEGNQCASFVRNTQKEAYEAQREAFQNNSGGEILIHGRNGKIRDRSTIAPMNDPKSSKG